MSQEIFREVEVGTGQMLTLGAPIPFDVQSMLSGSPPTYRMNPGTFGRAESITVGMNGSNVQSLTFRYAPGTDYATLLSEYTEGLGAPSSQTSNSATWQDSETTFQLSANGGSVTSVLSDR